VHTGFPCPCLSCNCSAPKPAFDDRDGHRRTQFLTGQRLLVSWENQIAYGKYRIALPRPNVTPLTTSMSSSLEDRIRLLTDRAITAKTQNELDAILPELKAAIRDHIRYLRAIAVETVPEVFGTQRKTAA
jgi:hypothetical protein